MHKKFLGYYKLTKEEATKMWKESHFVFDTSVLLDIYRYTPKTREDLFKILENVKNRIWIPFQVAHEYFEQRENVIKQQNSIYEDIENMGKLLQEKVVEKYKKGHPFADTDQIKNIFEDAVQKSITILKEAETKYPNLIESDIHLMRITNLFNNNVGDRYSKDRLHKIYEEAQDRFKEEIPPGYEDAKNKKDGSNKFGDVVLWYQLIDFAKANKRPVIFITSDAKEDWWRMSKDKHIIGPRPELINEFDEKAGVRFYMYLAEEFINLSQENLRVEINPETIREVREIRQQSELDSKLEFYRRLPQYHPNDPRSGIQDITKELQEIDKELHHLYGTFDYLLKRIQKDKDDIYSSGNIEGLKALQQEFWNRIFDLQERRKVLEGIHFSSGKLIDNTDREVKKSRISTDIISIDFGDNKPK